MGIIAKVDNSVICETFQKQCVLEKDFDKLQITVKTNETDELESKLKCLNINENNKEKLIERAPFTSNNTKPPKSTSHRKVKENRNIQKIISNIHNCGATLYYTTESGHQFYNNTNVNISHTHEDQIRSIQSKCNECTDEFVCDKCLLNVANTTEFTEFIHSLQNEQTQISKNPNITDTQYDNNLTHQTSTIQLFELNINQPENATIHSDLNINNEISQQNQIFRKPQIRRISDDSGIGGDIPSPLSDLALSPGLSNTVTVPMPLPPPKVETTTKCRIIRPKHVQIRKETCLSDSEKVPTNAGERDSSEMSKSEVQKEIFSSTLNPEVRIAKWVEYLSKTDTIFEVKSDGKTILHELLFSDEKYIEESFYTIVENMKKHPTKCAPIIDAQFSIIKAITENNHHQVMADYFNEAMEIIQHKQQNNNINT
ncbi:hypothetical protein ILUMI_08663 [Ignelater luminosus]|uniref:Uncharacterized protein n=1 Tax=Ignelater luminosus TaxID=2038154 RepID=A0A8K0GD68_IGNLU|nr:hypothetical protein ILUMI_08663 [Ignelater luminosus]